LLAKVTDTNYNDNEIGLNPKLRKALRDFLPLAFHPPSRTDITLGRLTSGVENELSLPVHPFYE
jgi:hypothetical protein